VILNVKNESGYRLEYATAGSIGFDLRACLGTERLIEPGRRFKFDTGISVELPDGYGAFVQPRSGLGLHHGIVAITGVIDRDYRGRIGVVLQNHGRDPYKVMAGDRIAQLVIVRVARVDVVEVTELGSTDRGASGFGSTGR
jgi:dUTP pyrophosphatase